MAQTVIVYHANCVDGFAAAFAAWNVYADDVDYVPCNYGKQQEKFVTEDLMKWAGKTIIFVDFSLKKDQLLRLGEIAQSVTVLDHHKTAKEDLSDPVFTMPKFCIRFDMEKSGAQIAWSFFNIGKEPLFIKMIGLRDLWKHKGTEYEIRCEALNMYLISLPFDFKTMERLFYNEVLYAAIQEGNAILRYFNKQVDALCKLAIPCGTRYGEVFTGVMVNAPYEFASEIGSKLSTSEQFCLIWFAEKDEEGQIMARCSVRSKAPLDVSVLAKRYGGGGHAQAAGFTVPLHELGEIFAIE